MAVQSIDCLHNAVVPGALRGEENLEKAVKQEAPGILARMLLTQGTNDKILTRVASCLAAICAREDGAVSAAKLEGGLWQCLMLATNGADASDAAKEETAKLLEAAFTFPLACREAHSAPTMMPVIFDLARDATPVAKLSCAIAVRYLLEHALQLAVLFPEDVPGHVQARLTMLSDPVLEGLFELLDASAKGAANAMPGESEVCSQVAEHACRALLALSEDVEGTHQLRDFLANGESYDILVNAMVRHTHSRNASPLFGSLLLFAKQVDVSAVVELFAIEDMGADPSGVAMSHCVLSLAASLAGDAKFARTLAQTGAVGKVHIFFGDAVLRADTTAVEFATEFFLRIGNMRDIAPDTDDPLSYHITSPRRVPRTPRAAELSFRGTTTSRPDSFRFRQTDSLRLQQTEAEPYPLSPGSAPRQPNQHAFSFLVDILAYEGVVDPLLDMLLRCTMDLDPSGLMPPPPPTDLPPPPVPPAGAVPVDAPPPDAVPVDALPPDAPPPDAPPPGAPPPDAEAATSLPPGLLLDELWSPSKRAVTNAALTLGIIADRQPTLLATGIAVDACLGALKTFGNDRQVIRVILDLLHKACRGGRIESSDEDFDPLAPLIIVTDMIRIAKAYYDDAALVAAAVQIIADQGAGALDDEGTVTTAALLSTLELALLTHVYENKVHVAIVRTLIINVDKMGSDERDQALSMVATVVKVNTNYRSFCKPTLCPADMSMAVHRVEEVIELCRAFMDRLEAQETAPELLRERRRRLVLASPQQLNSIERCAQAATELAALPMSRFFPKTSDVDDAIESCIDFLDHLLSTDIGLLKVPRRRPGSRKLRLGGSLNLQEKRESAQKRQEVRQPRPIVDAIVNLCFAIRSMLLRKHLRDPDFIVHVSSFDEQPVLRFYWEAQEEQYLQELSALRSQLVSAATLVTKATKAMSMLECEFCVFAALQLLAVVGVLGQRLPLAVRQDTKQVVLDHTGQAVLAALSSSSCKDPRVVSAAIAALGASLASFSNAGSDNGRASDPTFNGEPDEMAATRDSMLHACATAISRTAQDPNRLSLLAPVASFQGMLAILNELARVGSSMQGPSGPDAGCVHLSDDIRAELVNALLALLGACDDMRMWHAERQVEVGKSGFSHVSSANLDQLYASCSDALNEIASTGEGSTLCVDAKLIFSEIQDWRKSQSSGSFSDSGGGDGAGSLDTHAHLLPALAAAVQRMGLVLQQHSSLSAEVISEGGLETLHLQLAALLLHRKAEQGAALSRIEGMPLSPMRSWISGRRLISSALDPLDSGSQDSTASADIADRIPGLGGSDLDVLILEYCIAIARACDAGLSFPVVASDQTRRIRERFLSAEVPAFLLGRVLHRQDPVEQTRCLLALERFHRVWTDPGLHALSNFLPRVDHPMPQSGNLHFATKVVRMLSVVMETNGSRGSWFVGPEMLTAVVESLRLAVRQRGEQILFMDDLRGLVLACLALLSSPAAYKKSVPNSFLLKHWTACKDLMMALFYEMVHVPFVAGQDEEGLRSPSTVRDMDQLLVAYFTFFATLSDRTIFTASAASFSDVTLGSLGRAAAYPACIGALKRSPHLVRVVVPRVPLLVGALVAEDVRSAKTLILGLLDASCAHGLRDEVLSVQAVFSVLPGVVEIFDDIPDVRNLFLKIDSLKKSVLALMRTWPAEQHGVREVIKAMRGLTYAIQWLALPPPCPSSCLLMSNVHVAARIIDAMADTIYDLGNILQLNESTAVFSLCLRAMRSLNTLRAIDALADEDDIFRFVETTFISSSNVIRLLDTSVSLSLLSEALHTQAMALECAQRFAPKFILSPSALIFIGDDLHLCRTLYKQVSLSSTGEPGNGVDTYLLKAVQSSLSYARMVYDSSIYTADQVGQLIYRMQGRWRGSVRYGGPMLINPLLLGVLLLKNAFREETSDRKVFRCRVICRAIYEANCASKDGSAVQGEIKATQALMNLLVAYRSSIEAAAALVDDDVEVRARKDILAQNDDLAIAAILHTLNHPPVVAAATTPTGSRSRAMQRGESSNSDDSSYREQWLAGQNHQMSVSFRSSMRESAYSGHASLRSQTNRTNDNSSQARGERIMRDNLSLHDARAVVNQLGTYPSIQRLKDKITQVYAGSVERQTPAAAGEARRRAKQTRISSMDEDDEVVEDDAYEVDTEDGGNQTAWIDVEFSRELAGARRLHLPLSPMRGESATGGFSPVLRARFESRRAEQRWSALILSSVAVDTLCDAVALRTSRSLALEIIEKLVVHSNESKKKVLRSSRMRILLADVLKRGYTYGQDCLSSAVMLELGMQQSLMRECLEQSLFPRERRGLPRSLSGGNSRLQSVPLSLQSTRVFSAMISSIRSLSPRSSSLTKSSSARSTPRRSLNADSFQETSVEEMNQMLGKLSRLRQIRQNMIGSRKRVDVSAGGTSRAKSFKGGRDSKRAVTSLAIRYVNETCLTTAIAVMVFAMHVEPHGKGATATSDALGSILAEGTMHSWETYLKVLRPQNRQFMNEGMLYIATLLAQLEELIDHNHTSMMLVPEGYSMPQAMHFVLDLVRQNERAKAQKEPTPRAPSVAESASRTSRLTIRVESIADYGSNRSMSADEDMDEKPLGSIKRRFRTLRFHASTPHKLSWSRRRESSSLFFYNTSTGESVWTEPAEYTEVAEALDDMHPLIESLSATDLQALDLDRYGAEALLELLRANAADRRVLDAALRSVKALCRSKRHAAFFAARGGLGALAAALSAQNTDADAAIELADCATGLLEVSNAVDGEDGPEAYAPGTPQPSASLLVESEGPPVHRMARGKSILLLGDGDVAAVVGALHDALLAHLGNAEAVCVLVDCLSMLFLKGAGALSVAMEFKDAMSNNALNLPLALRSAMASQAGVADCAEAVLKCLSAYLTIFGVLERFFEGSEVAPPAAGGDGASFRAEADGGEEDEAHRPSIEDEDLDMHFVRVERQLVCEMCLDAICGALACYAMPPSGANAPVCLAAVRVLGALSATDDCALRILHSDAVERLVACMAAHRAVGGDLLVLCCHLINNLCAMDDEPNNAEAERVLLAAGAVGALVETLSHALELRRSSGSGGEADAIVLAAVQSLEAVCDAGAGLRKEALKVGAVGACAEILQARCASGGAFHGGEGGPVLVALCLRLLHSLSAQGGGAASLQRAGAVPLIVAVMAHAGIAASPIASVARFFPRASPSLVTASKAVAPVVLRKGLLLLGCAFADEGNRNALLVQQWDGNSTMQMLIHVLRFTVFETAIAGTDAESAVLLVEALKMLCQLCKLSDDGSTDGSEGYPPSAGGDAAEAKEMKSEDASDRAPEHRAAAAFDAESVSAAIAVAFCTDRSDRGELHAAQLLRDCVYACELRLSIGENVHLFRFLAQVCFCRDAAIACAQVGVMAFAAHCLRAPEMGQPEQSQTIAAIASLIENAAHHGQDICAVIETETGREKLVRAKERLRSSLTSAARRAGQAVNFYDSLERGPVEGGGAANAATAAGGAVRARRRSSALRPSAALSAEDAARREEAVVAVDAALVALSAVEHVQLSNGHKTTRGALMARIGPSGALTEEQREAKMAARLLVTDHAAKSAFEQSRHLLEAGATVTYYEKTPYGYHKPVLRQLQLTEDYAALILKPTQKRLARRSYAIVLQDMLSVQKGRGGIFDPANRSGPRRLASSGFSLLPRVAKTSDKRSPPDALCLHIVTRDTQDTGDFPHVTFRDTSARDRWYDALQALIIHGRANGASLP